MEGLDGAEKLEKVRLWIMPMMMISGMNPYWVATFAFFSDQLVHSLTSSYLDDDDEEVEEDDPFGPFPLPLIFKEGLAAIDPDVRALCVF